MKKVTWKTIEDEFRLWSFHQYYSGPYAGVVDKEIRFANALISSSAPIRDRRKVVDWWLKRNGNRNRNIDEVTP